jgi:tetratricopeptide (TPR) repeat protein
MDGWRVEDALTILEPAVAEFADLAEVPGVLALGGQLARALFLVAQAGAAVDVADRVLAGAERLDLVPVIADTLVTKGSALSDLGRGREGLGLIRTGLEIAEAHDIPFTALRALTNMSAFVLEQDPAAAIRLTRETLLLSRRLGGRDATIVYNAVWPAIGYGDWDWAAVEVEDLLEADLEPEDRAIMLGLAIWLRSWRAGDVADPLAELERLAAGSTLPAIASTLHEARAEVALATGRLAEAGSEFLEAGRSYPTQSFFFRMAGHAAAWDRDGGVARAVLQALEVPLIRGRVPDLARVTIRAGLAALDDRSGEALSLYREALRGWRDIGLSVDEAFTGIDIATLLDPAGPEVQVAAQSAREILARLGALPFIERLEAALGRTGQPAPGSAHPGAAGRPRNDPVTQE